MLSACAALPAPRGGRGPDWIGIGNAVDGYGPAELEQAYREADEVYRAMPSDAAAIRLALLLADRRSSHYDSERALGLLDSVIDGEAADTGDVRFARFLRSRLADAARLESRLAESAEAERALQERVDTLVDLERRLNDEETEP